MQDIITFIRDYIRSQGANYTWLESRRLELSPLLNAKLKYLLDGKVFIIITDDERVWFEHYFLSLINNKHSRPILPFFSLKSLGLDNNDRSYDLINDVLSLSFPNGHLYFYIGKDNGKMVKLAKSKSDSLLIIFDEEYDNSFCLKSNDEHKDLKLVTLARLINACVDGIIFSRIKIDK